MSKEPKLCCWHKAFPAGFMPPEGRVCDLSRAIDSDVPVLGVMVEALERDCGLDGERGPPRPSVEQSVLLEAFLITEEPEPCCSRGLPNRMALTWDFVCNAASPSNTLRSCWTPG